VLIKLAFRRPAAKPGLAPGRGLPGALANSKEVVFDESVRWIE
jgi:hypothetical protein